MNIVITRAEDATLLLHSASERKSSVPPNPGFFIRPGTLSLADINADFSFASIPLLRD